MINSDPQIPDGLPTVEAQVNASTWLLADWLQDSVYCLVEGGQVQMQVYCVISGIKLLTVSERNMLTPHIYAAPCIFNGNPGKDPSGNQHSFLLPAHLCSVKSIDSSMH